MAKIRIGFGTELNIGSELSGIGTDNPTNTKQVVDNIHATNAKAIGISTFTTYQGFLDKKATFGKSVIDINSQAGALSGEIVIDGEVTVSSGSSLCSSVDELTLTDSFSLPTGDTDSRIHCKTAGSMRFNEDLGTLEFYTGDMWRTVNFTSSAGRAVLFGGNHNPSSQSITDIGAFNITSGGRETIFGTLTHGSNAGSGVGSRTRGVHTASTAPVSNTINYVTVPSLGDSILFGDLASVAYRHGGAASSDTRGIFLGGRGAPGGCHNIIQYIQINTLGNALDFGDLQVNGRGQGSNITSPTRGFSTGNCPYTEEIQYINIASKGNAIIFGDQIFGGGYQGGCSNSVRGVINCGYMQDGVTISNQKSYITMASEGNAQEFGDLTNGLSGGQAYAYSGATQVRGTVMGGLDQPGSPLASRSTVDAYNFESQGETTVIGELNEGKRDGGMHTDSHGGLGGY